MATYESLSAQDKATLLAYLPLFRGAAIQYVKSLNALAELDNLWTNTVSAVVAKLDAAEVVPDATNLDGAAPLSHDDLITLMADIEQVLAAKNDAAHRAAYARICGQRNTIATG